MSGFLDSILNVSPALALSLVGLLVFAEDALFIGFVIPGETAAVLGGVVASRGHVQLWLMMAVVVLAAIIGDTVGYEIGKHFGPRVMNLKVMRKRGAKLEKAQDFLRRRGGSAVFLRRFVAFFRAVMPALAGTLPHALPPVPGLQRRRRRGLGWGFCSAGLSGR
ncbi:DedA family protein [Pseudarthrobacter sp. AL07]|uniref:DedA family protein n=1 Tax=unclassified Pseudarthrobacter TaxID=2647000 RepID=UPI00249B5711|nr:MULTISPECIES: DedA family protein [unclassified Pseudarthrobacter]MDI3196279.1 DedA family protein [Pseudarthrobacter sp. AL20]MDI3210333.1 DedA family protein [Pseudarthrobacter sp. AL07]